MSASARWTGVCAILAAVGCNGTLTIGATGDDDGGAVDAAPDDRAPPAKDVAAFPDAPPPKDAPAPPDVSAPEDVATPPVDVAAPDDVTPPPVDVAADVAPPPADVAADVTPPVDVAAPDACVPAGAEVCDGVDNDCNGLVDEGFCRVGGVCYTSGQPDPANICQVCAATTTASGPAAWATVPPGTVCGPGSVCSPAGACVPCSEGAACSPGGSCSTGRVSCARGFSECVVATALPSGTVCRASAGPCDVAEVCDGTAAACPSDAFLPPSTTCRASTGVCDAAERCTGSAAACPADAFLPSTIVCRASTGACDAAETCTGSGASCPADVRSAAGTVCRASGGACDVAEVCSGASAACPADVRTAAGTVCRASAGVCDVADACNGVDAVCPADAFLPSSTVCRASARVCDGAERCTGIAAACPADMFVPLGTSCGAGVACDAAGACSACPAGQGLCGGLCVALGAACSAGVGACARSGTVVCGPTPGTTACSVTAGAPSPEVCDNVDNDCNGSVDDMVTRSCYEGPGDARRSASPQAWLDACAVAGHQTYLAGSDDGFVDVTLPFAFRFFGPTFATAGISSNGVIEFPSRPDLYSWTNTELPNTMIPNAIFAFWDDLYQRTGICTATFGAAPSRQYVVEWNDNFFFYNPDPATHITLEAVLSETTNTVDVLYQRMEGEGTRASGDSATIGVQEGAGEVFDQASYNTAGAVRAGTGYRWVTAGTAGVGLCRAGRQTCSAGAWVGACAGQVLPSRAEVCGNGADDDCDARVDDGCP